MGREHREVAMPESPLNRTIRVWPHVYDLMDVGTCIEISATVEDLSLHRRWSFKARSRYHEDRDEAWREAVLQLADMLEVQVNMGTLRGE